MQEAVFAFTSGLTFDEYVDQLDRDAGDFLRRRYDTIRLHQDDQAYLSTYSTWLYLVLLVTEDSPDTMMITPVLERVAEISPRLDLRIAPDDADLTLLNELVDDEVDLEEELDDLDLPLLFIFDEEWNQRTQWGPRPQAAEERLDDWLEENPEYETLLADEEAEDSEELTRLVDELTNLMRLWYNDDLTRACVTEIREILDELRDEED